MGNRFDKQTPLVGILLMLLTHMLVKNEINLHVWAAGLVLVYGAAAITAHAGLGPGGEYLALAAAVLDIVIGVEAATRERRRDAKLIASMKIRSEQELESDKKRLKAEYLARRNAKMRDYEYWFQDVIKAYGLTKQGAPDRTIPVELCGVPVLAKHAGILVFIESDRVALLDPEKTGSSDAINEKWSFQDTVVDARLFIPILGKPQLRYIHDEDAELGARIIKEDSQETNEIWVFNVKDITVQNLEHLESIEALTDDFKESKTPPSGRIKNARKAMSAEQIENIYFWFPAILIYIERRPDGVCDIFSIQYCSNEVLKNIASLQPKEDCA